MAGAALDDFAVFDHDQVVGQRFDHCQVMADEQVRQAVFFLELAEQGDDLFLYRTVECRGRFVEQDQRRFEH